MKIEQTADGRFFVDGVEADPRSGQPLPEFIDVRAELHLYCTVRATGERKHLMGNLNLSYVGLLGWAAAGGLSLIRGDPDFHLDEVEP